MIFVFGSNLAGKHGAGAALHALRYHGAAYWQGIGRQGNSYAIPTKDYNLSSLPIETVAQHVDDFIQVAILFPDDPFQITRIGCGLAGFKDEQIAPLFQFAPSKNCFFDTVWRPFLGNGFEYWGTFSG